MQNDAKIFGISTGYFFPSDVSKAQQFVKQGALTTGILQVMFPWPGLRRHDFRGVLRLTDDGYDKFELKFPGTIFRAG